MTNLPPPPPPPPPQFGQPAATPQWTGPPLADLGQRFLGGLIDAVIPVGIIIGGVILGAILGQASNALGLLVMLAAYAGGLGFIIWNMVQQGNTGQSIGKKQQGTRLARLDNGQNVGAGVSVGRWLVAGVAGGALCGVGSLVDALFPLWDPLRQRIVDKIFSTVVVKV